MIESLRLLIPALLALLAAGYCDLEIRRRGFSPPGFAEPWRRGLAGLVLAAALFFGVFLALGNLGLDVEVDLGSLRTFDLFFLHLLFVVCLAAWYGLGYSSFDRASAWMRQFGLRSPNPWKEVGIGIAAGIAGWVIVMTVMIAVALGLLTMGGEGSLPQSPPKVVLWIAALPMLLRFAVSLSAGVVEEVFFRGFLQPRVGIAVSSLFFVLAHASYESPFMLVGVAILSLVFAGLVRWRQNILAAIVAHTVFDAVQLLVVIPSALDLLESEGLLEGVAIALGAFC